MEEMKLGWYLVKKSYRGGRDTYALEMTQEIKARFLDDWEELFDHVRINTNGGENDGSDLEANFCESKPKAEKTLAMETVTYRHLRAK